MPARRWFLLLLAAVFTVAAAICVLNAVVDPFGVFGDVAYNWYSFDMTNNPKAAKFEYLRRNHDKYDAYILGPSGSSSISTRTLGEYTGLSWYNMFNYGADMAYTLRLAEYIADNYEARHILLNLPFISAADHAEDAENDTERAHPGLSDDPLDWLRFLFANPNYAIAKMGAKARDSYLQMEFDVFTPETGAYDKTSRDAEAIGSLAEYLALYPEFTRPPDYKVGLTGLGECMDAVRELKRLCDGRGIALTVVIPPLRSGELERFAPEDIRVFRELLGEITPYHDFSDGFIPDDARYFYDTTHFRNCVGDMMLAEMFGDAGRYVPDDSGDYTSELTVYMYHDIYDDATLGGEAPANGTSLSAFEADMRALADGGYTTVGIDELIGYVEQGTDLPEKPVLITFDDGYMSNYELAFPVLRSMGYKAVMFIIGVSVGRDTYKNTGEPMLPHFGEAEMREMADSGLISIQSHSYDMHQVEGRDDPPRPGVLRFADESEEEYIAVLRGDYARSRAEIEAATGESVVAFAYPFGLSDKLSAVLLRQMGVKLTFSTEPGVNEIVKGLPQSLYNLRRHAR
ncbi:MAG: polysaccharide deacetylase family protein [Oscillospiraceae bacterium]|nr:polysaccharide deacetylase family protein [Oscillospiraceae bacterium]